MKESNLMKKLLKQQKIRIVVILIFVIVSIGATILLIPFVKFLSTEEGRYTISNVVDESGIFGPLLFILMQILQIVVAFLPGEPIEIIGGVLFGTVGGLIACLIGVFLGTTLVFFLVKKMGKPLVDVFVSEEKMSNIKLFNDEKKLELMTLLLFAIPGTPKDILTYIVPLTKIKPSRYFAIATFARIPSIVTSTLVGANISDGNWVASILIFTATILLGILGIIVNNKFTEGRIKNGTEKKKKGN